MGSSKRPTPARNRPRTRQHNPKLITDPVQSTLQLTSQLRSLGLYPAATMGDGNCLFRALADQLWGSPNGHLILRAEICDWMESRKERYEGFVDEDRTFDQHVQCMRIPGTYGGHLELSAFAHLKHRNVKVIQPGLVYVIEWNCGDDSLDLDEETNDQDKRKLRKDRKTKDKGKEKERELEEGEVVEEGGTVYVAYHDWEHFSSVRNLIGPHTGLPFVVEKPAPSRSFEDEDIELPKPKKTKAKGKPTPRKTPKSKLKLAKAPTPPLSAPPSIPSSPLLIPPSPTLSRESSLSSAPSPPPASSSAPASQSSTASSSLPPLTPPDTADINSQSHRKTRSKRTVEDSQVNLHGRSPKRTFEDTDPSPTVTSRKRQNLSVMEIGGDDDSTLLKAQSVLSQLTGSGRSSQSGSLSALSSPSPSPSPFISDPEPVNEPTPSQISEPSSSQPSLCLSVPPSSLSQLSDSTNERKPSPPPPTPRLTRRQRKALGLPHPRVTRSAVAGATRMTRSQTAAHSRSQSGVTTRSQSGITTRSQSAAASQMQTRSAGKITIPGGRRKGESAVPDGRRVLRSSTKGVADENSGEWRTNGAGRVDVRGFRELRI